jgi:lipopolysaccharide biosynthesis protein
MKARLIAHYLPQYHPIPENNEWWGPGFTEWTNVTKARPLFPGHYQPRLPADLGFYDLRVPESREQQAKLARSAGIEAFCYWHYWFNGRRILERPFNEVLAAGQPDFPFCLAWANESWQGVWHGCERRTLIEQTYGGEADCDAHFHALLPAFLDKRYLRVDGRPLFVIYRPASLPDPKAFIDRWNALARGHGIPGFHFVAHLLFSEPSFDWRAAGFDGANLAHSLKIIRKRAWDVVFAYYRQQIPRNGSSVSPRSNFLRATQAALRLIPMRILQRIFGWPGSIFDYADACLFTTPSEPMPDGCYPTAIPNWDNSARSGKKGVIFHRSEPEKYRQHLKQVVASVSHVSAEHRLVFLKSWNEWAEGNYLEPDRQFGDRYLTVTREEVS